MFQKPQFWGLVLATAATVFAIAWFYPNGEPMPPAGDSFRPRPADAIQLAPGIHYVVMEQGDGEKLDSDYVTYAMEMHLADGTPVMSSSEQGNYTQPVSMLEEMAPGIAMALGDMATGETRRYWIEPERMKPGYPDMQDSLHVIDFTLVGGRNALPAPENVAEPPGSAQRTETGIAWVVLEEGPAENTAHPDPADTVTVHYTGWTTDGEMFDSSVMRNQPAEFPLGRLIPGWQQAIPLMTIGDKFRFWIPGELAYDNSPRPGAPKGMLVFDIELLDFTPAEPAMEKE